MFSLPAAANLACRAGQVYKAASDLRTRTFTSGVNFTGDCEIGPARGKRLGLRVTPGCVDYNQLRE